MDQTANAAPGFRDVARHFSPAWFAAVMGTGVVPLAVSFSGAAWTPWVARIFVPLAALMFVAALVPWTLKHLAHRDRSDADFGHPVAASFLPTMPIALVVLALDLLRFGDVLLPGGGPRALALGLWAAGAAGIYLMGLAVLVRAYGHGQTRLGHANYGWFIPPVSKLLIPVGGFELAAAYPAWQDGIVVVSLASLGVGFFLYLFVGAAVYHRYVFAGLPEGRFAPTIFVGIAPPAIIAVALAKLAHLGAGHGVLGQDLAGLAALLELLVVVHWGLAAWWFVMALLVVAATRRRLGLPFALSWWAFTFPSGALAVASGLAAEVTGVAAVRGFYLAILAFLLVVWLVVAARTVRGMRGGRIFAPSH